jgi:endonuclease G
MEEMIMASETLIKFKEDIKTQVMTGDIKLALDRLHSYVGAGDNTLSNTIILLTGSYNRLVLEKAASVVDDEDYQRRLAQFTKSILDLLPLLEDITPPAIPKMEVTVAVPDNVSLEKIIGTSNLQRIAWLEEGLRLSQAVCRILLPAGGRGTGFVIAPGLLMTNHHVLPDEATARQAWAEFNYQQGIGGDDLLTARYQLDVSRFHTSPVDQLDYTIVGIKEGVDAQTPRLEKWGCVALNADATPVPDEHVVIIQHPLGGLKQIALTANQVLSIWDHRLHYTTDTMPGSSGSPVFNDSWKVVAIHHAGGNLQANAQGDKRFTNEGVLMSAIRADASSLWPG